MWSETIARRRLVGNGHKKQIGHANVEMIIRRYFEYSPNNTRLDGSALDRAAAHAGL